MRTLQLGFCLTAMLCGLATIEVGCSSGGGSGAPDIGGGGDPDIGGSTSTTENECASPGAGCSNTVCCQGGPDVGPHGAECISNDGVCHAICYVDDECVSGCCAQVNGESYGVCAGPSFCETPCSPPGGGCATANDCCQQPDLAGPYGAECVSNDDVCHAICYAGDDCASGCCVEVIGESYGVCADPAWCG